MELGAEPSKTGSSRAILCLMTLTKEDYIWSTVKKSSGKYMLISYAQLRVGREPGCPTDMRIS